MKKMILASLALAFTASTAFAGLLGDCTDKRFSREMEYLLMNQCLSTNNFMDKNQFQKKLEACSCYIGSLACEFGGSDEKLIKASEANKKLENNDKKYNQCSEKKKADDNSILRNTAIKAMNDAD